MNLYKIRTLNNKTQKQVANDILVSPKTYNNYENGNTEPDFKTLIKLANYFHVSIDYLLEHECVNKLDLSSLTPEQKRVVEIVQNLNTKNSERLLAYAEGLLAGQEEQLEILKKFKNID